MRKLWPAILLATVLILAWFGYRPGVSGGLHYDDMPNLGNLAAANTPLLQADFVLGGKAGPTGRPLSLLTFALQRTYWPDGIPVLLYTNIALHLLTGVLVYLLALGLANALRPGQHSRGIALGTATLWLLCPFLASAPLMLVQRMTVLSGLFTFAGLAAYVWGRLLHVQRPRIASWLIYGGLLGGTVMATLAKENGVLLLPLALVIEYTLLRHVPNIPLPSQWAKWLLIGSSVILLAYLAIEVPILLTEGWRPYTPWQRFITQPPILLEYLLNLLVPRTATVSPYTHWTQGLPGIADPRFWISALVLATAGALSWRWRARAPIVWFALMFFLTGHLLESSFIYLELYFAHRNYVPAFALYFLVSQTAFTQLQARPRLAMAGLTGYAAAFFGVLLSTTQLWGQPRLAAEMWAHYFPQSTRALHTLANEYVEEGNFQKATRILDDIEQLAGEPGMYRVQSLLFCVHDDAEAVRRVQEAVKRFQYGPATKGIGETLELLARNAIRAQCPTVTKDKVQALADAVLSGNAYISDRNARAKAFIAKARLAGDQGEVDTMLSFIHLAFESARALDVGLFAVSVLAGQKRYDDALQYLALLEQQAHGNVLQRFIWRKRIDEWRAMVTDGQASAPRQSPTDER